MNINIALTDDHQLVRGGIRLLLENINGFKVMFEAGNGKELIDEIDKLKENLPDIVLVDVNMPVMEGPEAVTILRDKYPDLRIVALSVNTDMENIRNMIRSGANAYLFKDSSPETFEKVLREVYENGFFYSSEVIKSLMANTSAGERKNNEQKRNEELMNQLTAREKEFIVLCCSEKTYRQIADEMGVSQHTVNGYRESAFQKLSIHSRTGLVIYAVNTGMFTL